MGRVWVAWPLLGLIGTRPVGRRRWREVGWLADPDWDWSGSGQLGGRAMGPLGSRGPIRGGAGQGKEP